MLSQISKPLLSVGLALILGVMGALASLTAPIEVLRDRAFDLLLQHRAGSPVPPDVVVVDIDRTTLDQIGSWPWSRDRLAALVEAIAVANPKAIGFDFLLVGGDERSPGALARQLALSVSDAGIARLARDAAERLPDADLVLAEALQKAPAVLGLVLDGDATLLGPAGVPVLVRGGLPLADAWATETAVGAIPVLARAAHGHGVLLLPGDADARIRRVPLMVATKAGPRPGLALEMVRLSLKSSSYVLRGDIGELRTGTLRLPLGDDGMLRLRPSPEHWHALRTFSAAKLLQEPDAARSGLRDKFVLLGSSAPELGGLRPSAAGSLVPSVQIQADSVAQMLAGFNPIRGDTLPWIERAAAVVMGAAAIWAALSLSPIVAGLFALALAGLWIGASAILVDQAGLLLDPILVSMVMGSGFGIAVLHSATETRRREAFIRRRFEQHLAPAVVQRIVDEPHLLKLSGEAREITVIFTDIEGFTSLTERAGPVDLVALLDKYIDGASRIIVEHGGMVDKIIGDGMHALFNAPIDLADHPRRAFDCALALKEFSEALRQEPDPKRLGLGRTRIGIETGPVIVGDVGGGGRLNYTAHGNAVNRAARLEAANKELASTICIGPVAATRLPRALLRPLGRLNLRGVSEAVEVYEPWDHAMTPADRALYEAGFSDLQRAPETAAEAFRVLASRYSEDKVISRLYREALGATGGGAGRDA